MSNNKIFNNSKSNCESALALLADKASKDDISGFINVSELLLNSISKKIVDAISLLKGSEECDSFSFSQAVSLFTVKNDLLPKFSIIDTPPIQNIPCFIKNAKEDFEIGEMDKTYYFSFIEELYNEDFKTSILAKLYSFASILDYFFLSDQNEKNELKKYLYSMDLDVYLSNLINDRLEDKINVLFKLMQSKDLFLHKDLKEISLEAGLDFSQYMSFEGKLVLNTVDCISLDDLLPKNKKLSPKEVKYFHSEQKLLSQDSKLLYKEQRLRILAYALLESRNLSDFIEAGFMVHGVTTVSFYETQTKVSDKDYLKKMVSAIEYVKSYENWWSNLELSASRLVFCLQTNISIARNLDKTLHGICLKGNIRHFENLVSLAVNLKGLSDVINFNALNMYLLQANSIINFNINDMSFNISKLLKLDFIKDIDSLITESNKYYLHLCHKERYMPYAFKILNSNYFNAVNFKRGFLQVGHSVFRFVKNTQDLFNLSVDLNINVEKYYPDISNQSIVILHGRIADESSVGLVLGVNDEGLYLKEMLVKKNQEQTLIAKKAISNLLDKILVKKMYLI